MDVLRGKWYQVRKNYTVRSFLGSVRQQILIRQSDKGVRGRLGMYQTSINEKYIKFWLEGLKGDNRLRKVYVVGERIKMGHKRKCGPNCTCVWWSPVVAVGKKWRMFGLHMKSEISLGSARAPASQEQVFTFRWLWKRCVIFFLRYRSFVNFWPLKFSSGRVGASHLYNYSGSGLEDETKTPCPWHLTFGLGPSASPDCVFVGQKLTSDQYMFVFI